MPERDKRQPIEDRHVEFARAVVALARQFGMRWVKLEAYGGHDGEPWTKVSANWSAGRHGAPSDITLQAEATHITSEKTDA